MYSKHYVPDYTETKRGQYSVLQPSTCACSTSNVMTNKTKTLENANNGPSKKYIYKKKEQVKKSR